MGDSAAQGATSPKSPAKSGTKSPTSPRSPRSAASPGSEPSTAAEEPVALEVDDQQGETDEQTFDEQRSSYTASLSSSVLEFPVEHGRRYHAFRKGAYMYPNDDREADRLDVMHHIVVRTLGGRIYLAPIHEDKVQNILDVGTGTGTLAIELADAIPNAQVIGCDLSPTQAIWTPPNLKFEVDDIESEWTYPFQFDFVISRYMASSVNDWPRLVVNIYDNLSPGGWAELQDFALEVVTDDGSLTEDHDFYKWIQLYQEGLGKINRDSCPGPKLRLWAEAAGFENIREEKFKIPAGTWPKDPVLKQTGMMNLVQMLDGMEAFSLKVFEILGWSRVETEVFLAKVRKEMKSGTIHGYLMFYVVYGQKPRSEA